MQVFLFTDIEGSTQLWEKHAGEMSQVLVRHDTILRENIGAYGGKVVKHTGDGLFAVFEDGDPLPCVLKVQKQFEEGSWGPIGELRIRIGLHSGYAQTSEPESDGTSFTTGVCVGPGVAVMITSSLPQANARGNRTATITASTVRFRLTRMCT